MNVAAMFATFGTHECPDDPLYVALCALVAQTPSLGASSG